MAMPTDIGIIDLMLDPPALDDGNWAKKFAVKDAQSLSGELKHPAGYMFKDAKPVSEGDPVSETLRMMDRHNVEMAVIRVTDDATGQPILQHPDRFMGYAPINPNEGMEAVRKITAMHEKYGIVAASFFPAGCDPQVPINDKRAYPIYAKCVELDIACFVNCGVPGPRVPFEPQYVGHLDEVCYFFPELRLVMRHGASPWIDLAVALMLKWPNLYYSTSAFAPKYYPKGIVDFANTRGADKILYAGYFPHGLTLERIFSEMQDVPFRDTVWPKFLRENALAVLRPEKRNLPAQ
jgi:predicted TIM-barrel fold metal-dependent hydrolase